MSNSICRPQDSHRCTSSRREFLKSSAQAVSSVVLAGAAMQRAIYAAGDDVLKVGLIGCGGRGTGAAAQALGADPHTKLIAMADIFEDKVKGSRNQLRKIRGEQVAVDDDHCFVGFDGYQKVIDSGVDVVVIACTSTFHAPYLRAAVAAGKHVFVEKPHAIDPPGIRMVKEACDEARRKGLSVVSGLCWRYSPIVRETMKRVLDGAIGDIVAIQETYMRGPYRLVERRPEYSELEYQYRNWYHFRWLSGDDIPQSLLHCLDKACWALHEQPPVKAFGLGGRSSSFGAVYGDVFDHHSVVYEYANGVRVFGNCRAQTGCYGEVSDILLGTKGRADLIRGQIKGETDWRYKGPKANMYDIEHQELFASIRSGRPINNGDYMVNSTMTAILGQMVVYTGKQITWEQAWKSNWKAGRDEHSFELEPPVKPLPDGTYPVPVPGVTQLK
ncbi:MAG: Gfo/Idh/MocA family oxidoreductase [Planctomycetes bacterium]|nr:Gfo/Idh/MocA family oxidoreductase [Planctomycetota bacterium]